MLNFVEWLEEEKGRQARLAECLGVSSAAITQWVYRSNIPPRRVRAVSEFTGIACSKLNPEVFGDA